MILKMAQTIAQELNCVAAQSLQELVSSPEVDCVILATPNYLHKEPVIEAAKHGKHVFCEKPIALNYSDCDEMVRTREKYGVIFMAGHVMNFFNGVHHAKELIKQGVIGKVLYCYSARNGWEDGQPSISWKKIRAKSGGHFSHHIHELDCIQFIMGGMPKTVTMTAGNVAHQGEKFGDEDDMLFLNLEFEDGRFAVLEWGSAFRWGEHYVLIQREKGAIQYGKPGKRTPMWLSSIMKKEMKYLNDILHGMEPTEEFKKLLTGEAARAAIATADASTKSRYENRKVDLSEIIN